MVVKEGIQKQLIQQYPHVFEIDANLDRLVKKIELLTYLNPQNIEKEKQRFFASKYTDAPVFKYKKLQFDPYALHQQLFSQKVERIQDKQIRKFYQEVIYYYANMIQCIETIGQGKRFYYNSLRVYGTPTDRDVQNARFILHFKDEDTTEDMVKKYSPEDAKQYFEKYVEQYNFPLNVSYSTSIAADAMVSNNTQSLLIKKNASFSRNQILTLAHHEIGVHLVTTYNGLAQPLKVFSNGFPKNVETQEGLAVFSEYMGGALSLKRLKELAYRVIASDSLIKGFSFSDTFDMLHGQYKLERNHAFTITMRVHRGGGFTKDRLYLSGLRKIYQRYKNGLSMDSLLTGKVSLEHEDTIVRWTDLGLSHPSTHFNVAFKENKNTNKKLDFILDNLK
ncbi:MAG: flavohemoglobin expression-modulating QEGLA motif protein [Arenibacter latericius]|nr:flavohemoglobin expression-modulating QEGLA motif protein [Arenibacter latericius]